MKIPQLKLLETQIEGQNNFYILRLICAILVIFSHSFDLLGLRSHELYRSFVGHESIYNLGTIGVCVFFLISGFLVTKSWFNSDGILDYLKKRALRIYPALIVVIFLTLFVLGPLVTTVSLKSYFFSDLFNNYLNNFLMYKYSFFLTGVFESNPLHDVNGAIWTIAPELRCYLLVAIFGLLSIFKNRFLILPIIILAIFFSTFSPVELMLYVYFLIGQACYLYRDKIILNKYLALVSFIIFMLIQKNLVLAFYLNFFLISYIAIYLAFAKKYFNFEKCGDFSYGLYIYAFPIQQLVINYFGHSLNPYSLFLSALLLTFLCAALSWHLVEKRALALKKVDILRTLKRSFIKKQNDVV